MLCVCMPLCLGWCFCLDDIGVCDGCGYAIIGIWGFSSSSSINAGGIVIGGVVVTLTDAE